ncbi:hypothetical protein [Rickettsia endosymbiont of Ceutorhynchus obstrictus]|uniref:hypothetical protein n=1 Tax=Rickettsia endosymbiont of Ceutorhynchus obstrictus TaxID=3066249 RepID=UPI0031329A8A
MLNQINILYPILFAALIATIVILIIQLLHYKKKIVGNDLRIIQFYLDKKFLDNKLTKNFELQNSQKYPDSFFEDIKFYFKLDDARIISIQDLEEDKELSFLFKEKLDSAIAAFLSEPQRNIAALYKVLDRKLNTESDHVHRLYVFLPRDKINQKNQKTLIYVKIPHIFNKDELETLDIYMHLVKIFSDRA